MVSAELRGLSRGTESFTTEGVVGLQLKRDKKFKSIQIADKDFRELKGTNLYLETRRGKIIFGMGFFIS
jgi:hypothetical protein